VNLKRLAATAIAVLALSAQAQAGAIVTETLNGTITGGVDSLGFFGTAGADLTGDAIALSFIFDTGLLNTAATNGTNGSSYSTAPEAQTYNDYANDASVSLSMTIGGETVTQTDNSSSSMGEIFDCGASGGYCLNDVLEVFVDNYADGSYAAVELNGSYGPIGSLTQANVDSYVAALGDFVNFGGYGLPPSNVGLLVGAGSENDGISFDLTSSPEPATWLSLGFGLFAVALHKFRLARRTAQYRI
jgi:hypothetical protein